MKYFGKAFRPQQFRLVYMLLDILQHIHSWVGFIYSKIFDRQALIFSFMNDISCN